jgi:glutathione S-transferase
MICAATRGADPRTLLKVQFDRRSNHATLQNSQRDFRFQRDGSLITRGCSMSTLRTGNNSPFGRKARIAVNLLGLERQVVIEPASTVDAADPIRQQNPLGKVPVLLLDDGAALYDSPVILEYLDHLAGGGRIIPADPPARFAALRLQALADGIMDASILINYEARYRPVQNHEPKWLDLQAGKVTRALAVLEAAPPGIDTPPNVGQITLACALGYRDFRFPGSWRGAHPRLAAWLDDFAARVPAFAATTPPG